jgi:hypothetical protein
VVVDLLDFADAGHVDLHRALRLRMRPKEKTTSSAVKGVPSWNFTPLRRSKRTCVGLMVVHLVASAGSTWYELRVRSGVRPS